MLGVASHNEIPAELFAEFQKLALHGKFLASMGEHHQDGWGIAGYFGNWATHFGRSEKGAVEDSLNFTAATRKALLSRSRIIIAHLRKASEGSRVLENAHPFIYNDWIFCHNGTVRDSEQLVLNNRYYEGATDSERLFKFILNKIEHRSVKDYPWVIKETLAEIKERCASTSLTFLLSNHNYLVGYRDYTEEGNYYSLYYSNANNLSFLFCSEKLPGYDWNEMQNGELVIVDKIGGFLSEF
jgi:glutamine amidotransferase